MPVSPSKLAQESVRLAAAPAEEFADVRCCQLRRWIWKSFGQKCWIRAEFTDCRCRRYEKDLYEAATS